MAIIGWVGLLIDWRKKGTLWQQLEHQESGFGSQVVRIKSHVERGCFRFLFCETDIRMICDSTGMDKYHGD